ncbi:hypothetical protein [Xenorhabdus lircayensis]|uniref:Uncharacterized protein n=1 Tax=Xenorhabdus lircayensis TaxID=2763499 RepID=A0ABS0U8J1_9GAMM|nr:hypothetical protein [Xenorhabdus lircayensis]MBI6550195.1 hypothetical protein [Xenorhabdus lircayensis]
MQSHIKEKDFSRKTMIDAFVSHSRNGHLDDAILARKQKNKIVWQMQSLMAFSRLLHNVIPLLVLSVVMFCHYLEWLNLQVSQLAALVIISTVLLVCYSASKFYFDKYIVANAGLMSILLLIF